MVTPPPYPFVEIALLEASQFVTSCTDRNHVIAELRRIAGSRGCDLVIIYGGNDQTYSAPTYLERYRRRSYLGYRATCGVYYASSPVTAPQPTMAP